MARWLDKTAARGVKQVCSKCGAPVSWDGANDKQEVTLCRRCGTVSYHEQDKPLDEQDKSFDPVAAAMAKWSVHDEPLQRPAGARTRLEEAGRDLVLRRRTGSLKVRLFTLVWFGGWAALCVHLVRRAMAEPTPEHILLGLAFLAGGVIVLLFFLLAWFGRERLAVGSGGIAYRWSAFFTMKLQRVTLEDVRAIRSFVIRRDGDPSLRQHVLGIRTKHGDVRFGKRAAVDELLWLADMIRRQIHMFAPDVLAVKPTPAEETPVEPEPEPEVEVLQATDRPHARPEETEFTLRREQHRTELAWKWSWRGMQGALVTVTCLNLFCNGILAVLILRLIDDFSGGMLAAVILLGVGGLVMFLIWLLSLWVSISRTRWVFEPDRANIRTSVFGIGRTRQYDLNDLDRLELRPSLFGVKKRERRHSEDEESEARYVLVLVKSDGEDLLRIGTGREDELRWIADELFRDFEDWLVKVGKSDVGR